MVDDSGLFGPGFDFRKIDGTPMFDGYTLSVILITMLAFEAINQTSYKYFPNDKDAAESVSPLTHSLFAVFAVGLVFLPPNGDVEPLFSHPKSYVDPVPYAHSITSISFGFFIWDLTLVLRESQGMAFTVHAVFCSFLYAMPPFLGYLHRIAILALTFEFSTVFLRLQYIFEYLKWTRLQIMAQAIFGIVFFVIRILFGSYISKELWYVFVFRNSNNEYNTNIDGIPTGIWVSILVINLLFHCLNIHWFTVIINNTIKFIKSQTKHPKKAESAIN